MFEKTEFDPVFLLLGVQRLEELIGLPTIF